MTSESADDDVNPLKGQWLGTWTQHDEQPRVRYELHIAVDHDVWRRLIDGAHSYRALVQRPTFEAVQRLWHQLQSTRQFYENLADYGGSLRDVNHASLATQLMADVTSWLALTRLYLESQRNIISDLHGSDSEQARRLKAATSHAFDTSVGYRFLYNLRDYAQHCGPPLGGIEWSRAGGGSAQLLLYLDRSELLRSSSRWSSHARAYLKEEAQEHIDLLPLLADAMNAIEAIDDSAIALQLERVAQFIDEMRRAVTALAGHDGNPLLFERRPDGTIVHENLPPLDGLDQVAAWLANPSPIVNLRRAPKPVDTSGVHGEANRRAAAVVGTWLRHGPGADLDAIIEDLTRTQLQAAVLVSGLVNLSAHLLSMMRLALGTSREDLVGAFAPSAATEEDG